ncbi:uncharacterized protein LOC128215299 [Mya arenaria]|uniref:uncharacterized protein LOC128215299 n=1 Tax=Mya arenaria TaxID=6604 RepID=UPI0022E5309A|nr:uncharacterized protein LOC128215299 [Mya arenaria]
MMLFSLTPDGLQSMLHICYEYTRKNRYMYNASKCKIVVYNDSKPKPNQQKLQWLIGRDIVEEAESYVHLGITKDKYSTLNVNIDECCAKLRRTYFGLGETGLNSNTVHPLSIKRLYESVVLPKALYGCEVWNRLTSSQILQLERAHRTCVKNIQSMPRHTRSDITLSCLAVYPLETYIDKRKLLFFGQLCRTNSDKNLKRLFIYRLFSFINSPSDQIGFVPDLYRLFCKYSLKAVLEEFMATSHFPNENAWKTAVRKAIHIHVCQEYKSRGGDTQLETFKTIHCDYSSSILWVFSKIYSDQLLYCRSSMRVLCKFFGRRYTVTCHQCNILTENIAAHSILYCRKTDQYKQQMWKHIYKCMGAKNYQQFVSLEPDEQMLELLSGFVHISMNDMKRVSCFKIAVRYVHILGQYRCNVLNI